jgi:hypothetical protein
MPLERIYTNRVSSMLIPRNPTSDSIARDATKNMEEYRSFDIQHGKVYAKHDGENYIVNSVNSTDMNDYLNVKYIPGSILSEK